ncbi:MAG: hypothetical protein H0U53_11030 [Actinobacteria bacterium]|nr:hypothetical protein [Actinomycetota bacterium]
MMTRIFGRVLLATILVLVLALLFSRTAEAHTTSATWSIKKAEYAVSRDTDAIAKCHPFGIVKPNLMQRLGLYKHLTCTIQDGAEFVTGNVHVTGNWSFTVTNTREGQS